MVEQEKKINNTLLFWRDERRIWTKREMESRFRRWEMSAWWVRAIKWGLISKQISLGKWHCHPRLKRKTPYLHTAGSSAMVFSSEENFIEKRGKMQWSSFCIGGCFYWAEGRLNYKRNLKGCIVFNFTFVTHTFPRSKCCQYYLVGNECGESQFYIHFNIKKIINFSFVHLSNTSLIVWGTTSSCEHHPELHSTMLLLQSRPGESDPKADWDLYGSFDLTCMLSTWISCFPLKKPTLSQPAAFSSKGTFPDLTLCKPMGASGPGLPCSHTYKLHLYLWGVFICFLHRFAKSDGLTLS